ncbi:hypothetical protein [Accumulibacter sp.]|uniref:hypothetical protein n=1 Tax=Accumulibacter sp. TaxID=2053492 RepID=UPI00262E70BD|nr:hypothetical protein [Accumulibacter sp.]
MWHSLVLPLLAIFALGACGHKGQLTLPPKLPTPASAASTPSAEATAKTPGATTVKDSSTAGEAAR